MENQADAVVSIKADILGPTTFKRWDALLVSSLSEMIVVVSPNNFLSEQVDFQRCNLLQHTIMSRYGHRDVRYDQWRPV